MHLFLIVSAVDHHSHPALPIPFLPLSPAAEFEELERGLLRMDIGLSRAQLVELMNALDADRDGRIQFSEFAARFRLLFSKFQDDEAAGTATSLHALTVSDSGAAPAGGSGAETPGAAGAAAPGASGRGSPSLILVDAWTREALGRVGDALFSNGGGDLQEAFKLLDSNRDGLLSPDEFTLGIHKLNLGFTEADVHRLLSAVDANHSGYINFSEFAAAFRAADVKTAPPSLRISPGASATGGYLLPPGATAAAEAGASSGGSGTPGAAAGGATLHDIRAGAGAVGEGTPGGLALPSPPHGADSPLMRFGRRGSDEDLAGAASAELSTATGRSWQQGVIEQIVATLFEYRVEMASAFRMFDTNNDGVVSREEFREGLQALAGLSASSLTDMQCDEIMRALDKDGNGVVDFAEVRARAPGRCCVCPLSCIAMPSPG
jgi:Ca2+-binding EF-hand superfamily protein